MHKGFQRSLLFLGQGHSWCSWHTDPPFWLSIPLPYNLTELTTSQSRQSFFLACIVGLIGLALIIAAVLIGLFTDKVIVSAISGASGISFEVLAGFILQLYKQASVQLATFHQSIDDMHRFLVANSICESLEEKKEDTRSALVLDIARFSRSQPETSAAKDTPTK